MPAGYIIVFVIIAAVVSVGQIGGCVECEKRGGAYVQNSYGTYSCVQKR